VILNGDPELQYLTRPGDLQIYVAGAALWLVFMSWIASQREG